MITGYIIEGYFTSDYQEKIVSQKNQVLENKPEPSIVIMESISSDQVPSKALENERDVKKNSIPDNSSELIMRQKHAMEQKFLETKRQQFEIEKNRHPLSATPFASSPKIKFETKSSIPLSQSPTKKPDVVSKKKIESNDKKEVPTAPSNRKNDLDDCLVM